MKEVKPCVERNQREDEMRRERDIMMRVSVTICGHVRDRPGYRRNRDTGRYLTFLSRYRYRPG